MLTLSVRDTSEESDGVRRYYRLCRIMFNHVNSLTYTLKINHLAGGKHESNHEENAQNFAKDPKTWY